MSLLRLIGKNLVICQILLVSLLLPTLHFHTEFDHKHASDPAHKHTVAHADFFPGAHDQTNREKEHEDHSSFDSHVSFSSVVTRWFNGHFNSLRGYVLDLLSRQPTNLSVNSVYRTRIQSERSPPIHDALRSFFSPRAPPQFFVF
jgi:hypothetical protein